MWSFVPCWLQRVEETREYLPYLQEVSVDHVILRIHTFNVYSASTLIISTNWSWVTIECMSSQGSVADTLFLHMGQVFSNRLHSLMLSTWYKWPQLIFVNSSGSSSKFMLRHIATPIKQIRSEVNLSALKYLRGAFWF